MESRFEHAGTPLSLPALPEAPLVSVLVACYNYGHYLGAGLADLLGQPYPHLEIVVCDDGSTDDSREVVARYAARDPRVRLLCQENAGVASALNAAYRACHGEVICLLDADDLFAPGKVEAVVRLFRARPGVGLAMHAVDVIDEKGRQTGRIPLLGAFEEGWIAGAVRRRGGRWRNLPASALSFRRAVTERLFPIPEDAFRSEADGYLFTLAPLLTRVGFLPEPLACYRLHGANLTGTQRLDRAVAARRLDALERVVRAVNTRLAQWDPGAPPLDVARNLNYREMAFVQALCEGQPRPALVGAYRALAGALWRDDLYDTPRKLLGLFAYGAAVLLPAPVRAAWLSSVLGASSLRRLIQRLAGQAHGRAPVQ